MRLADKTALVTGAASGMGAAIARTFAREGARVVLADVTDDLGRQVADELVAAGGQAFYQHLDIADEAQWQAAVEAAVSRFGRLDILVNNAGISGGAVDDPTEAAGWSRLVDVNAKGVFLGMKHAIPVLLKQPGGAVVNVSSVCAQVAMPNVHHGYAASKAAVSAMTKSAALDNAKAGLRVNAVLPGVMLPMRSSRGIIGSQEVRDRLLVRVPLGRTGTPDDVAGAVLFLASDEAAYITGAELPVDGGYLAT